MSIRFLTATAVAALLAAPAFADCEAEIASLDEVVIAAETGIEPGVEMPATEHQEEVLGMSPADDGAEAETDVAADAEPVSPHQLEVLAGLPEAEREQLSGLLAEARELAAAGDEAECMARVEQARAMLGGEN